MYGLIQKISSFFIVKKYHPVFHTSVVHNVIHYHPAVFIGFESFPVNGHRLALIIRYRSIPKSGVPAEIILSVHGHVHVFYGRFFTVAYLIAIYLKGKIGIIIVRYALHGGNSNAVVLAGLSNKRVHTAVFHFLHLLLGRLQSIGKAFAPSQYGGNGGYSGNRNGSGGDIYGGSFSAFSIAPDYYVICRFPLILTFGIYFF